MDELITITGNKVLVGEPIAKNNLPKQVEKIKKEFIFELRYKGKVIDPKEKLRFYEITA